MDIFINDIRTRIVKVERIKNLRRFDTVIHGNKELMSKKLKGKVLVYDSDSTHIFKLMELMQDEHPQDLTEIFFAVNDKKKVFGNIKKHFKIIKAAGGVVQKEDRILLIYRFKKWDLPKGKFEKGESKKQCAQREVEEETNVRIVMGEKICSSWHTYVDRKKRVLKKTYWYKMHSLDDSKMAPQKKEKIDDVAWCTKEEAMARLANSYNSIKDVVNKFYKL